MLTVLTQLVAINVYAIMVILEMDHNVVSCSRIRIDTNAHTYFILLSLLTFKWLAYTTLYIRTSHVKYQIW